MGANINIKNWKIGMTSRRLEEIETDNGDILRNITTNKVSTPVITVTTTKATIVCATTGSIILYKKNSGNWTVYSSAVTVAKDDEIKAFAVLPDTIPSDTAELTV